MFINILFGLLAEVLPLIIADLLYIISMVVIVRKMWLMDEARLKRSIDHHFWIPPVLALIGGIVDVLIYAESVGGIQGGTPYTFMVIFNTMISVPATLIILYMCRKIIRNNKFKTKE